MAQQEQPPSRVPPEQRRAARPTRAQMVAITGFAVLVLIGLAVFFVRAARQPRLVGVDHADASNPTLVAAGQQLYLRGCAGCHPLTSARQPDWQRRGPHPLLPTRPSGTGGPAPQRSDAWLFTLIRQGGQATGPGAISGMPAYSHLSDGEIWALVSFIKSTWPAP